MLHSKCFHKQNDNMKNHIQIDDKIRFQYNQIESINSKFSRNKFYRRNSIMRQFYVIIVILIASQEALAGESFYLFLALLNIEF